MAATPRSTPAVRADADETDMQRVKLEQDLARRFARQVDSVRRKADTAHAARVAAVEAWAVGQVEATRRDTEAALAAQEADLETQAATRLEAAVREAQSEATQRLVATMRQHDAALAEVRVEAQADVARAEERVAEVEQTLTAIRQQADLAQAEVQRVHAERAHEREQAKQVKDDTRVPLEPTEPAVARRGMAEITGAVVPAGFAGVLIGWLVAFSGILY